MMRDFADLFGQDGHVGEFIEITNTVCLDPSQPGLGFLQGHREGVGT